jgi:hypothetical protein
MGNFFSDIFTMFGGDANSMNNYFTTPLPQGLKNCVNNCNLRSPANTDDFVCFVGCIHPYKKELKVPIPDEKENTDPLTAPTPSPELKKYKKDFNNDLTKCGYDIDIKNTNYKEIYAKCIINAMKIKPPEAFTNQSKLDGSKFSSNTILLYLFMILIIYFIINGYNMKNVL